jgi:hypothetical protein
MSAAHAPTVVAPGLDDRKPATAAPVNPRRTGGCGDLAERMHGRVRVTPSLRPRRDAVAPASAA